MNERALNYIRPPHWAPWRWSDDGEVLLWNDHTVAFRQEVVDLLDPHVEEGFIEFECLVFFLAATRPWWAQEDGDFLLADEPVSGRVVLEQLARVYGLVQGVAASLRPRIAGLLFEEMPRILPPEDARSVLDMLEAGVVPKPGFRPTLTHQRREFEQALRGLVPETLEQRLRTGLEILPAPAVLPSIPEQTRQLVEGMRDEPLGRLTLRMMAVATIPNRLHASAGLEVGGTADIATRGRLDRLLLSELAHDAETLAMRVAQGEALYVRREPPPSRESHTRAILLDVGLRMWGLPRVFATATALAFLADAAKDQEIVVARFDDEDVPLHTKAGLVGHLASLDGSLDVREHVTEFVDRFEELDETILIVHRDTFHDEGFQAACPRRPGLYVATVDREGSYRLHRSGRGGWTRLREARLDLSEILADEESRRLDTGAPVVDLPHWVTAATLPFLMPVDLPFRGQMAQSPGGRYFGYMKDGRLLAWEPRTGALAKQLALGPPCVAILHLRATETRLVGVVKGWNGLVAFSLDLESQAFRSTPIPQPSVNAVEYVTDRWIVMGFPDGTVRALDMETSEIEYRGTAEPLPKLHPSQPLFFRSEDGICRFVAAGDEARSVTVKPDGDGVWTGFTSHELGTPHWILEDHRLISSQHDAVKLPIADRRHVTVSLDGRRVHMGTTAKFIIFDAVSRQLDMQQTWPRDAMLEPGFAQIRGASSLRKRWQGIGVENGTVVLQSHKGFHFEFTLIGDTIQLRQAHGSAERLREFQPVLRVKYGFDLREADWQDGSVAILDGRGLLHLRDARSGCEITILLRDGSVAAVARGAICCGPESFLEGRPSDAASVMDAIREFAEGR